MVGVERQDVFWVPCRSNMQSDHYGALQTKAVQVGTNESSEVFIDVQVHVLNGGDRARIAVRAEQRVQTGRPGRGAHSRCTRPPTAHLHVAKRQSGPSVSSQN